MNLEDAKAQMRVAYVPNHATGIANHPDVECGVVSSSNDLYVFVKFDKHVANVGLYGATAQSCRPEDLMPC